MARYCGSASSAAAAMRGDDARARVWRRKTTTASTTTFTLAIVIVALLVTLLLTTTHTPAHATYTPSTYGGDRGTAPDTTVDTTSTMSCTGISGELSPTVAHGQSVHCTIVCRANTKPVMATVSPFTFCSELTTSPDSGSSGTNSGSGANNKYSSSPIGVYTASNNSFCVDGSAICAQMSGNNASSNASSNDDGVYTYRSGGNDARPFPYGYIDEVTVNSSTSELSFTWFAPLVGSAAFLRVEIGGEPIVNSPIIVLLSGGSSDDGSSGGGGNHGGGSTTGSDSTPGSDDAANGGGAFAVGGRNFILVVSFGCALLLVAAVWIRGCVRAHAKHREFAEREQRDQLWLDNVGAADMRAPFRSWFDAHQ